MTDNDVIQMMRQAGLTRTKYAPSFRRLIDVAAAAEREKVAQWMMQRGYATGHGDTIEDLLAELDWQIAENWNRAMINGMKTEREACALAVEQAGIDGYGTLAAAAAIRARGQG